MVRKNNKGFTLVEVIVVAVIVAILAAVAIPLYLNYVDSSRTNSAANAGGSVASFLGACRSSAGTSATVGKVITCTNAATGNTTMQIPADVSITQTAPVADGAGSVVAQHDDGGDASTYSW